MFTLDEQPKPSREPLKGFPEVQAALGPFMEIVDATGDRVRHLQILMTMFSLEIPPADARREIQILQEVTKKRMM